MTGVLPALLAGLAAALVLPGTFTVERFGRPPAKPWSRWLGLLVMAVVLAPQWSALLVIALLTGLGAARLWRDRGAAARAARTSARVVEVCDLLAAELVAGQPPIRALERASSDWESLRPVLQAHAMGGDVAEAFRRAAEEPGAGRLRQVAAGWQVSQRVGHGLATAVEQVAADLRRQAASERVVRGELASARATARLVAVLPLGALAMGSGVGGHPWHFLLRTPAGLASLALGLALGWLGLWWIDRIAAGVEGA